MPPDTAYLKVKQFASRYAVRVHQVLGFIRSGELAAIDVSTNPGVGRPNVADPAFRRLRFGCATGFRAIRRLSHSTAADSDHWTGVVLMNDGKAKEGRTDDRDDMARARGSGSAAASTATEGSHAGRRSRLA